MTGVRWFLLHERLGRSNSLVTRELRGFIHDGTIRFGEIVNDRTRTFTYQQNPFRRNQSC